MSYLKFSIVIPFSGKESSFQRSVDYIFMQDYPIDKIEIIIVNYSHCKNEQLSGIEQKYPDNIAIIEIYEEICKEEAINIGKDYCTGDYILFLNVGDVLNISLFQGLGKVLGDERPDLIEFLTTSSMQEFDLFLYQDFDTSGASLFAFYDVTKKKEILNNNILTENYHAYAYSKTFLASTGYGLNNGESEEENSFVYPLLLLANSLMVIPEQGYCHFHIEGEEKGESRGKRITCNLRIQLELYGQLRALSELFSDYYDLIDAHFLRRYFIHTIELIRGEDSNKINLQQIQLMQLTCLRLIPKWIDNDHVYAFSRRELKWLSQLYSVFESVEQIKEAFCSDAMVSVIMTTYNRAYVLKRGIDDILQQSWQNFEFIIVNDNSSDETEEILKSISDSRIRCITNKTNRGVSYARNLGLREAKGEYVIFQDDDDLSRLDKLEKMMKTIKNTDDRVGAVYHEIVMYTKADGDRYVRQVIPDRKMNDIRKRGFIFPALLPKNFITTSAILLKRKALEKIGFFNEELVAYEDWDLCLRLSKEFDVEFIKEPLYDYLRSDTGLISNDETRHREKVLRALYLIDLQYEADRKQYNIESNFKIVDEAG